MNGTTTPPAAATARNSGLAVCSLVLGILSLTCLWLLAAIPAVICGHRALARIRESAGALKGQGLAKVGLITGYISIGLSVLGIILGGAIGLPAFMKAREQDMHSRCLGNQGLIQDAKEIWMGAEDKDLSDTPTREDLSLYLGDDFPVCPAGGTYTINPVGEDPVCSIEKHRMPGP